MDIRQLKAFVAVFEERNITQAALRLHLTQSALSVTIRQLESSLDTVLFLRQARGVELTEAARLLYPQARRLLAQADGLRQQFRQRNQCLPLTLGIDPDVAISHVSRLLAFACREVPALLLHTEAACTGDARLAAEEDRCEDELFLPLWDEPFVLAASGTLPWPPGEVVVLGELTAADWIICPTHPSHQRLLAMFGEDNHALLMAAHAGSLMLALLMVRAGMGLALLPASWLEGLTDVHQWPLGDAVPRRRTGLCYAAHALENPALAALHQSLLLAWPRSLP